MSELCKHGVPIRCVACCEEARLEREGSGASPCSPVDHLVMLHRVLYNTVTDREALDYLNRFRREDADFADLGRPLKFQYQENPNNQSAQSVRFNTQFKQK